MVGKRPHVDPGFAAITDSHVVGRVGEVVDELLGERLVDKEPAGGDADLAGIAELADGHLPSRRLDFGVVECKNADRYQAGEGYLLDDRRANQMLADPGRVAGDNADNPGGKPGIGAFLRQQER